MGSIPESEKGFHDYYLNNAMVRVVVFFFFNMILGIRISLRVFRLVLGGHITPTSHVYHDSCKALPWVGSPELT